MLEVDFFTSAGGGSGGEKVIQLGHFTVGSGREVARKEMTEGVRVVAMTKSDWVSKEFPLVELGGLGGAVWTML